MVQGNDDGDAAADDGNLKSINMAHKDPKSTSRLGSGASGGASGERWALATMATALRIWDRKRKARNSGAAGAGWGA
ncbi:hypothetical protein F4809DRAFT_645258 [Biscogniauxia mediterranea]|nr:hypothetical protein F4809DRAFT_645258 [Biscogniauxia mediterranea]